MILKDVKGVIMGTSIKIAESLANDAKHYASVMSRSVPKQIEHWAKIGKIAEENPDLSYEFIKDILLAAEEVRDGDTLPYEFS